MSETEFCTVEIIERLMISNQQNLRSATYFAEYYPNGFARIRVTVDRLEPHECVPISVGAELLNIATAAIAEHVRACRRHDT